jgi:hypothetical protein
MSRRLRLSVEGLFVFTEALAWYYVMYVFSSIYERGVLRDLAFRIDVASAPGAELDAIAGSRAAEIAREAAQAATAGPQWYTVFALAFGAFTLTSFLRGARIGRAGTVLGLLVSMAALSLAWRVVLVGDARFWDFAAVARFFEPSDSSVFLPIDVTVFAARPDVTVADNRASGLGFVGVLALWMRFLYAGRSPLRFESVLRSFSGTFPAVLIATFAGSAAEVPGGGIALLYFTSAVLTLALANARRATDRGAASRLAAGEGRGARVRAVLASPWAFAAVATVALVAATAGTLVLLDALNVGAAVLVVGSLAGRVFEFVLVLLITPIYWVITAVSGWLGLGQVDLSFMSQALDSAQPNVDGARERGSGRFFWIGDALRLLVFAVLCYGVYKLAQYLFRRIEARRPENAEGDRSAVASSGGLGHLLRAAFSGRGRASEGDDRWLQRHPAYWLYGRMVRDAVERRFAPRPGETPLEFATASTGALDAPLFGAIAAEFDRARYGAHFADEEALRPLAEALRAWEAANPITAEIRMRPGRDEEAPEVELGPPPEMPEPPPELMPPV